MWIIKISNIYFFIFQRWLRSTCVTQDLTLWLNQFLIGFNNYNYIACNKCAAVSTRLSTTPVSFSFATSTQFTFDSFWPSRVVHEGHFQTLNDFFFLILNNFQSISFLSVFIFGVLVSMSWQPQKYKIIRNLFLKVRSDWNQYHVRDDEIGRISHNWLIQGAIIWSRCKFYMRRRLIYIAFVCTCFCIYDRCWFI